MQGMSRREGPDLGWSRSSRWRAFSSTGLLYLLSHRTKGQRPHGHGSGTTPTARRGVQTGPRAPARAQARGDAPAFKALHTVVGTGSVALSCLFAFGAIFDVGLSRLAEGASHVVTLYRWIPLGVNEAVGQIPGRAGGVVRGRGVPPRFPLGPDDRLRDVRRLPDPRLLGRLHGPRRGLRALLRVPEPLHVLDARARARRQLPAALRRVGRASGSARTS